ncbi:MAG: matrixin family metalloprotease, partial [Flavobacteriaceae bacterium]|nr:matrixin family metalloprotease [Flavobacteriaceae bacterium]
MKSVFIIAIVAVAMIGVMVPNVYAETWYYYVEPLPEYASYANNVMELSTTAWEDANDNLQFIEVSSPQQANFQVQWVKEFGVEHVGYAYGSWFIEVGLGDSNCGDGMWQPYSEQYTTDIMTHEIGHVLGFDHVNDPDSIMYPVAINWEYGNVEIKETLTSGYGYFQPICTSKDVTTFDWHVSSDDPTYGFDVYFVPSYAEFEKWQNNESISYFNDNGCFAENMLSIGGTCEGVTQDSGLLVIMGDDASEPLTEITLNLQENNSEFSDDVSNSEKSLPSQNSNDIVLVDNTFSLYVDPQQKFSIKYPSNWIVDSTNYGAQKVLFLNEENWKAQIYVVNWGEIDYAELSSSEIFDNIVSYEQEFCNDATFVDSGQICYDFQLGGTDIGASGSDQKEYIVSYDATLQYDGLIGVEYPTTTLLIEKHDGSNAWTVFVDVETEYYESFVDVLVESAVSFEVIKSGESSSTTNSIPIPIPIPQPDIITSTGTATLSETSVNISSGQSEQIKIYGTINDVDKSTRVSITYTYPDGTTDGGTIFTTNTGVYETYLNLDKNSPIGNYEILVTAKGKIIGSLNLQVNDKILDSHPFAENEISSEITSQPTIESVPNLMPEIIPEPPLVEPLGIASFVDTSKDP